MHQLNNNPFIYISDVRRIPAEAVIEKQMFTKYEVKSILLVPVVSNDLILGFLVFNAVKQPAVWVDNYIELLQIISNILANGLVKVNAEKQINYMAYYDGLTGLSNRTFKKKQLTKAIDLSKRTMKWIGVVFIDIDGFKSINDSLGHDAGDEVLKKVGRRLSATTRQQDSVCRFGGDEFLVMFTNIDKVEDMHVIAKKMMKIFQKPMEIKNQELFISASAGIAMYPIDGEQPDQLIKNADLAMYQSKESGKNKYTLCSSALKEDVMIKMRLTNSLYRALERDEMVLYYQPQISLETHEIIGMEALIRWNHPELGMISPTTFIPLAEEQAGLILPIDQWVLMTVCQQSMQWQKMGIKPIRMAVNLSGKQFKNKKLLDLVKQTILETGLDPKYLELEITESIAIQDDLNSNQIMQALKAFGVSIAIDDFGLEYSSLNRLKNFPIDRIKMDIEFVRGLTKNKKDEAIAKVIIQLAKNLNLKVIAEGVETESQMTFLKNQQCDEIQGYYYYKPMKKEEIEKILKDYKINPKKDKKT